MVLLKPVVTYAVVMSGSQVVVWCVQSDAMQERTWCDSSLSVYILVMVPAVMVDKAKGP